MIRSVWRISTAKCDSRGRFRIPTSAACTISAKLTASTSYPWSTWTAKTWRRSIRRIGRLPPDKGVEIARQLCAGLAAAHDKGVLHRDLKPANVMLDGRGRVRITDFGLARLTDEKGGRGVQAGTPAYMAPEQAAGREVTERSDLYSLGLLLYEVFTGKSVTLLRSGSTPPTLSSAVPDLDGSVERVILRCLEWEPAQRPASAWAVAAAFPGSDPLLAALAAGETPSPEMVAAAGGRAGLPVRQAVACLVILGIGLLLACLLAEKTYLSNRVELETPTHLREVVRAWLEKHPKRLSSDSADEADGFTLAPDPATAASSIHYWYRRRSAPLLPTENGSFGNVDLASPPLDSPEEISIELDGTGHLVRFVRVPPSRVDPEVNSDATRPPTEWEAWFPEEVTGFHFQDLVNDSTVLKGRSLPSHPYDDIRGWKRKSDDPAHDQYVIVAAFQGHPTHFEIGPWNPPAAQPVRPNFWGWLMLVLLPVVAAVALRNYWSGRVDRQTVTRVAAIIFVLGMFKYILSANHQWGQLELMPLFLALASSAFLAAYFAFWYSGLEPLVRRIWPQTLITWTRAVAGQLRDPLVGRDLLLGTVFGVLHLLIVQLGAAIQNWTGIDDVALPTLLAESLLGVQGSLSAMLQVHLWAFQLCVFSFAILVLLRHLLRREMLAIAAFGAVCRCGTDRVPECTARFIDLGHSRSGHGSGLEFARFRDRSIWFPRLCHCLDDSERLVVPSADNAFHAATACWVDCCPGVCRKHSFAGI